MIQPVANSQAAPEKVVAIDFGTTFSSVTIREQGKVTHVSFAGSGATTPTVIQIEKDGTRRFGKQAENAAAKDPLCVHKHFKRAIPIDPDGRRFGEHSARKLTTEFLRHVWATVRKVDPSIEKFIPELGGTLDPELLRIVITCPATFTLENQRVLQEAAAEVGDGFRCDSVITESVAASYDLRERLGTRLSDGDHLMVNDLGGGTFDISVMQFTRGVFDQIVGGRGDDQLGGLNATGFLYLMFCEAASLPWQDAYDPIRGLCLDAPSLKPSDRRFILGAWTKCDEAKIDLAVNSDTTQFIETPDDLIEFEVSRDLFVQRLENDGFYDRFCEAVATSLDGTGLAFSDIKHIGLVGGSALLPQVGTKLAEVTGHQVSDIHVAGDASHTISDGAAICASYSEDAALCLAGGLGIRLRDPDNPSITHNKFFFSTGQSIAPDAEPIEQLGQMLRSDGRSSIIEIPLVEAKAGVRISCTDGAAALVPDEQCTPLGTVIHKVDALPPGDHPVQLGCLFAADKHLYLRLIFPSLPECDAYTARVGQLNQQSAIASVAYDLLLLFDCSASMAGSPLDRLKDAGHWLLDDIAAVDVRAGIVSFGRHTRLASPLGSHHDQLCADLDALDASGTTPMAEAFALAEEHFRSTHDVDRERIAIMVTDGCPNDPNATDRNAEVLKQLADLHCVGVGAGVNESMLRQLATQPSQYYFAEKPEDITGIFQKISTLFLDKKEYGS